MMITKQDLKDIKKTTKVWELYEWLFCEKAPPGWTIEWGMDGLTILQLKTIYLFCYDLNEDEALDTVIHELLHVNSPHLPHGEAFDKVVKSLVKKVKNGRK